MTTSIRPIGPLDVEGCARAAFAAHQAVAAAHNVPPEVPSEEHAIGLMRAQATNPTVYGLVAERDGHILGSIFLNTFPPAPVASIGPLTVDPTREGGVGRQLMEATLEEARRRGLGAVRLVQSPSHMRSLVLYAKLGFTVREPLLLMQGQPPGVPLGTDGVRAATADDLGACNAIAARLLGLSREAELRPATERGQTLVVERAGRIVGYASGLGFLEHAVAETTDDLAALIAHAPAILGLGFFVPTRNTDLLRRLLDRGFRGGWPATLMTLGPYQEPAGAFLPSINF